MCESGCVSRMKVNHNSLQYWLFVYHTFIVAINITAINCDKLKL